MSRMRDQRDDARQIYVSEPVVDAVYKILADRDNWRPPPIRDITDMVPYSQGSVHKAVLKLYDDGRIDSEWRPQ